MSAVGAALRGALGRMAGALGVVNRPANRAPAPATGAEDSPRVAGRPAAADDFGDDLLDRERQLRALMSSWM